MNLLKGVDEQREKKCINCERKYLSNVVKQLVKK